MVKTKEEKNKTKSARNARAYKTLVNTDKYETGRDAMNKTRREKYAQKKAEKQEAEQCGVSQAVMSSLFLLTVVCPVWPVTEAPRETPPHVRKTQVDTSLTLLPELDIALQRFNASFGLGFDRGKRVLECTGPVNTPLHKFLADRELCVCCNDAYRFAHFHHFAYDISSMESICPIWTGEPNSKFDYVCSSPPYNIEHREQEIVTACNKLCTKFAVWKLSSQNLSRYRGVDAPDFVHFIPQTKEFYPRHDRGMFVECFAFFIAK